jgi:hypothetical protein
VASEPVTAQRAVAADSNPLYYVGAVVALLAAAGWGYMRYLDRHSNADIPLTAEARAYARNLQLSDVEMKASENYFQQAVV